MWKLLIGIGIGYYLGQMTPAQKASIFSSAEAKLSAITGGKVPLVSLPTSPGYDMPNNAIMPSQELPAGPTYSRGLYQ